MKIIKSVEKALTIIEVIANGKQEGLSLTELSKKLEIPKSTLSFLIATLEINGYIKKSASTGRYVLGLKLFKLGNIVSNNLDIRRKALIYMEQLVDRIGETAHLVILDNGEAFYIEKVEGNNAVSISSKIGRLTPLHVTAVGKVLMAYLDEEIVNQIFSEKDMISLTENTITDPMRLKQELSQIRKQGYAFDMEEMEIGLRCIAAPIKDYKGDVIAAISVSGPTTRITIDKLKLYKEEVLETAKQISISLGYNMTLTKTN